MDEGKSSAALDAAWLFDIQLFAEDLDTELGPAFEVDVDALGDDAVKLKQMLGKALHDNKRVRAEAGKRRTALRATEAERDGLLTQVTTLTTERDTAKGELETANRSKGQHLTNFKNGLIERDLRASLTEAGMLPEAIDLALPAIKRDGITCDDEKFEVQGVKEVVDAFKAEKPALFGKPVAAGPRGTSTGAGPTGGAATGGAEKISYRDSSKTLEQIERERDIANFGRPTAGIK